MKVVLYGKSKQSLSFGYVFTLRTTGDDTQKEKWAKVSRIHTNEFSFHFNNEKPQNVFIYYLFMCLCGG